MDSELNNNCTAFVKSEIDLMDSWGSWSFSIDGQNMLKISYDSRNDMYVPRDNLESNDHGEFVLNEEMNVKNAEEQEYEPNSIEVSDKDLSQIQAVEIARRILMYLKNDDMQQISRTFDELKPNDLEIVLSCTMKEMNDNNNMKSILCPILMCSANITVAVIMQHIMLPWSEVCCDNASDFIFNLSEFVEKFRKDATHEIILPLLKSPQSILVEDQQLLIEVMSHLPSVNWKTLLNEYIDYLDSSIQNWQLPILLTMTDKSRETLNEPRVLKRLIDTCACCVTQYTSNINFGQILISIGRYDILTVNMKESIRITADNMKGIIKMKVLKSLK